MTEISERYRRLAAAFIATVEAVPSARWDNASPCEGWSALDVVRHVVDAHLMQLGLVSRELENLPAVESNPAGAVRAASEIVGTDLEDPERARAPLDGPAGPTTFEQSIDNFLSFDLVVHRWDLARATGLDERLPVEDVRRVAAGAEAMGAALRAEGVCGPALSPPPDSDEQTRVLAFLGRRAW